MRFKEMKLSAFSAVAMHVVLAMSPSSSSAQEGGVPADALQSILDNYCLEVFSKACSNNPHFCVGAVARYGAGSGHESKAWRCYSEEELDFNVTEQECVNNCGEMTSCNGGVREHSVEHLSKTEEILAELDALRTPMCKISSRQA